MPAEWEAHERCLIARPTHASLWHHIDVARRQYAGVANAIAGFEPVLMVVDPGEAATARRALTEGAEIVELPIDDSWMRDNGPIFVVDEAAARRGRAQPRGDRAAAVPVRRRRR